MVYLIAGKFKSKFEKFEKIEKKIYLIRDNKKYLLPTTVVSKIYFELDGTQSIELTDWISKKIKYENLSKNNFFGYVSELFLTKNIKNKTSNSDYHLIIKNIPVLLKSSHGGKFFSKIFDINEKNFVLQDKFEKLFSIPKTAIESCSISKSGKCNIISLKSWVDCNISKENKYKSNFFGYISRFYF